MVSGPRATIRWTRVGKESSTGRPLTVNAPSPGISRTRATAPLRRPVDSFAAVATTCLLLGVGLLLGGRLGLARALGLGSARLRGALGLRLRRGRLRLGPALGLRLRGGVLGLGGRRLG